MAGRSIFRAPWAKAPWSRSGSPLSVLCSPNMKHANALSVVVSKFALGTNPFRRGARGKNGSRTFTKRCDFAPEPGSHIENQHTGLTEAAVGAAGGLEPAGTGADNNFPAILNLSLTVSSLAATLGWITLRKEFPVSENALSAI